jgi:hypothetical protein
MWWIWIALLAEAVGLLLVWGLLRTAAPRSEKERCYEDEAQVRALAALIHLQGRDSLADVA